GEAISALCTPSAWVEAARLSLSPSLRAEGWGEGQPPRARLAESPPHPNCFAIRPLPARGARCKEASRLATTALPARPSSSDAFHASQETPAPCVAARLRRLRLAPPRPEGRNDATPRCRLRHGARRRTYRDDSFASARTSRQCGSPCRAPAAQSVR